MSRRPPTTIAAFAAFALALAGLTLGVAAPALAVDGTVSGTVFRDFSQNGLQDAGDQGLGGVTVTAYDSDSAVGSVVSAADGSYSISVLGSDTQVVRVEFTDLPAGYEHGAVSQTGADTGTSVRFVDLAAGTGTDFSVHAPEDYSQENPPLITSMQWAGSADAGVGTRLDEPALVGLGFDDGYPAAPQPAGFPNRVTLATFGEIGATSGNAYQASSNSLYAAATYKRQSGLGPLGLGGLYRVTEVLGTDGEVSDAGIVEQWLDLEAIGIDLGPWQTNAARGLAGHQDLVLDADAFANVGKVGIGDLALSPDGNTLYFVNLWDKQLLLDRCLRPQQPARIRRVRVVRPRPRRRGAPLGPHRLSRRALCRLRRHRRDRRSRTARLVGRRREPAGPRHQGADCCTRRRLDHGAGCRPRVWEGRRHPRLPRAAEQAVEHLDRHLDLARRVGRAPLRRVADLSATGALRSLHR